MSQLYTSGRWTVAPGREEKFVAAWSELAEWTAAEVPGSNWARLLQHHDKPNTFLSFGPWDSAEAIAAWRELPGFQERVERIRGMLEDFEPGVFDCRAEIVLPLRAPTPRAPAHPSYPFGSAAYLCARRAESSHGAMREN